MPDTRMFTKEYDICYGSRQQLTAYAITIQCLASNLWHFSIAHPSSFPPPWTLYHVNFPKKRAEVQTKLIQDSSHVAPVCLDALTFEVLCSWKKVPTAASKPLTSISVYYLLLLNVGAGYYAQLLGPLLISTCESTMLGCYLCRQSLCRELKYVHVLRYKINPT